MYLEVMSTVYRLLMVEDSPDDAELLLYSLRDLHFKFVAVRVETEPEYAAALSGMGIAGLPSFVVEDALLEHALERVLPEWHLLTATLYAAMPTRKHVPARTRAFIDFLVQAFGGQDHDPWLLAAGCATPRRPSAVALK